MGNKGLSEIPLHRNNQLEGVVVGQSERYPLSTGKLSANTMVNDHPNTYTTTIFIKSGILN